MEDHEFVQKIVDDKNTEMAAMAAEIRRLREENDAFKEAALAELLKALGECAPSDVADGLRLMLVKNAPTVCCSYCGLVMDNSKPEIASQKMFEHIIECKKNPLVILLDKVERENRELCNTIDNHIEQSESNDSITRNICYWIQEDDPEISLWRTSCRNSFYLDADKPSDNNMKYCCYCGGIIKEEI